MIIVMQKGANAQQLKAVKERIRALGYRPHVIHGETRQVIGAVGDERGKARLQGLQSLPGVESVVPILKPYKLASQEIKSLAEQLAELERQLKLLLLHCPRSKAHVRD